MSMPQYDIVTKRHTSNVENAMFDQAKSTAEASRKSAANSAITNTELKKLNATTQQIAAANAALVAIQTQALNESNKQTAILDAQLQIAQINELEKTRQNQIKQAAFSVGQKMDEISKESSAVRRYFFLKDELYQVEIVELTPDAPNEIADKQYVKDMLAGLSNEINAVKLMLSKEQVRDVDMYYPYLNELSEAESFRNALVAQLQAPNMPSLLKNILMHTFLPNFSENANINKALKSVYYVFAIFALLISWQMFVVFIALRALTYVFARKKIQKNYDLALKDYGDLESNIKNAELNIERLKSFFIEFKINYSLPA